MTSFAQWAKKKKTAGTTVLNVGWIQGACVQVIQTTAKGFCQVFASVALCDLCRNGINV